MRKNIFGVSNQINKHKAMHVYPNYYKNIKIYFSSQSIRMRGNKINFDDKKIKKVTDSTIANKKKYLI